jgi:spore germination cell wall hydrolase CwlJ-like protein
MVNIEALRATVDDFQALALTLMFEGGGEPIEGRIAIGSVIRNRVGHPKRFQPTFRGVCTARSQFSCWWSWGGAANFGRLVDVTDKLLRGETLPFSALETSVFQECCYVAEGIIGGQIRDRVRFATHYYNPAAMVPKGKVPEWAKGLSPVAKVGAHLFFVAA